MKKTLLGMCGLFLPLLLAAQTDFRPGYLINSTGDSLKGYVNYRADKKSFAFCEFKSGLTDAPVSYTPSQIRGYGYDNDAYYQSIKLKSSEQPLIFIEVLVNGALTLYKSQHDYYISKGDSTLHKLFIEEKTVNVNGVTKIRQSSHHIGILNMLTADCNTITNRVSARRIQEKPLIELTEEYNACVKAEYITYKSRKPWVTTTFGVAAGMSRSALSISIDGAVSSGLVPGATYSTSLNPTGGLVVEFSSPRINERALLYTGILYANSSFDSYSEFMREDESHRAKVSIEVQELKVPVGLKYQFKGRSLTPYGMAGVSYTHLLKGYTHKLLEVEKAGVLTTSEYEPFAFTNGQLGYWLGLGLERDLWQKKRAFGELRFEATSGLGDQPKLHQYWFETRGYHLSLMVGVKF